MAEAVAVVEIDSPCVHWLCSAHCPRTRNIQNFVVLTYPSFIPIFFLSHSQELQAEVNAHKQQVQRVLDKGKAMVIGQHPSAQNISEKCQELMTAWQGLEKACEERMKQLQHSVGFQEVQITAMYLHSSFFRQRRGSDL